MLLSFIGIAAVIIVCLYIRFNSNDDVLSDDADVNLTYWAQNSQDIITVKVKKKTVYVYVLKNKDYFYYEDTDLADNPHQFKSLFYSSDYDYTVKYQEVFHITDDEYKEIMKYKDRFVRNTAEGYNEADNFDDYEYLLLFADDKMFAEPIADKNNQILSRYLLRYCGNIPESYTYRYKSLFHSLKYYEHSIDILGEYKDELQELSEKLLLFDDLEIHYQKEYDSIKINQMDSLSTEETDRIKAVMRNAGFKMLYIKNYMLDDSHTWKVIKYSYSPIDDTDSNMWDERCLCYVDCSPEDIELINADNKVPIVLWNIEGRFFCS